MAYRTDCTYVAVGGMAYRTDCTKQLEGWPIRLTVHSSWWDGLIGLTVSSSWWDGIED